MILALNMLSLDDLYASLADVVIVLRDLHTNFATLSIHSLHTNCMSPASIEMIKAA